MNFLDFPEHLHEFLGTQTYLMIIYYHFLSRTYRVVISCHLNIRCDVNFRGFKSWRDSETSVFSTYEYITLLRTKILHYTHNVLFCVLCSKITFNTLLHYNNVMTTLTEVFPCFFLSCRANARVKTAKTGHGPHSS